MMLEERKQEGTETNEQQAESIWGDTSNVTTDIPQSLQEAIPNPYPVGSDPIRIWGCHLQIFFRTFIRRLVCSAGYNSAVGIIQARARSNPNHMSIYMPVTYDDPLLYVHDGFLRLWHCG